MSKQIVVYLYNGLLLHNEKTTIETWNNMDKSQNKPNKKSIYYMIPFILRHLENANNVVTIKH